jgi:DNA polymerase elongation subunit (family B)
MRYKKKDEGLETMVTTATPKGPKILTIDIETTPIKAYTWGPKWQTNLVDFIEHSQVLSYSAKWLGGKQETKGLVDYKSYKKGRIDDKQLIKDIYKLLEEADIVVTQNGIDFDQKVLNTRFAYHGLPPPAPYKSVDTKREAKKYLRLPSNSLNDLGAYFNLGKKTKHHGFDLWLECIAGDEKAWKLMKKYNAQDVKLTEQVYLKLRPFMKTHPNVGTFTEKPCCTACGNEQVQWRGYARNASTMYRRYQCVGENSCGHWDRAPTKEKSYTTLRGV